MRRVRSEGKRGAILDAAAKVVVREGIWNATTRKIASEAGINLATLHYHFDSKEDLLFELFQSIIAAIRDVARDDYADTTTLADRIEIAFRRSWQEMELNLPEQVLQLELTLYAVRAQDGAWMGKRQYDAFIGLYVETLRGASDVAGAGTLDIEGLARFMIGGLDGVLTQHLADPDPARSAAAIRTLVHLAQHYPLTDPGASEPPVTALTLRRG